MRHTVETGCQAPVFSTLNQHGQQINLAQFRPQKKLVLYFYPKAATPGCTVQACGMRDFLPQFAAHDVVVMGISPDPVARLKKFSNDHHLNFDLLSDEGHVIAESYGVWGAKKMAGRQYMGLIRTTFIIDGQGTVQHVIRNVKTKNHHQEVLTCLSLFG